MGNYKFKLSDMIPNAWFYKLKDVTRIRTHHNTTKPKYIPSSSFVAPNNLSRIPVQPHLLEQRKSYYFTRDLTNIHPNSPIKTKISNKKFSIDSPRKSSSRKLKSVKRRLPNRLVTSVSASCNCHTTLKSRTKSSPSEESLNFDPTSENEPMLSEYGSGSPGPIKSPETFDGMISWSTSCQCRTQNDIIYDKQYSEINNLPRIITKNQGPCLDTAKIQTRSVSIVKENISRTKKRFSTNSLSPGLKRRTNSPKIGNRRTQVGRKSSCSGLGRESLAVVKLSEDPVRDFMESMVEMILENNITAAKELEELLVCYLLLNSDEYHGIIINVFKQIWSEFVRVRLK